MRQYLQRAGGVAQTDHEPTLAAALAAASAIMDLKLPVTGKLPQYQNKAMQTTWQANFNISFIPQPSLYLSTFITCLHLRREQLMIERSTLFHPHSM